MLRSTLTICSFSKEPTATWGMCNLIRVGNDVNVVYMAVGNIHRHDALWMAAIVHDHSIRPLMWATRPDQVLRQQFVPSSVRNLAHLRSIDSG